MYRKFGKRLLDIFLSGVGILVLLPVYLLLAVAIKIDDPGPVFFRQKRVGIHKSHFQILKFRTMKMDAPRDVPTHLLENPEQLYPEHWPASKIFMHMQFLQVSWRLHRFPPISIFPGGKKRCRTFFPARKWNCFFLSLPVLMPKAFVIRPCWR